ncbi:uncharacterized protein LOC142584314 [Dermacentor variabilis]|uniref:uncharacterized protein LOC142584314 n=1 Tax=Dermacentor variabilis TaxID=34621 RepID=UPI003F5BBF48
MFLLHRSSVCVYAWVLISTLADASYRDDVLRKYFMNLVPPKLLFSLPDHYFALRNPFDVNGTLYRFNLTDGRLRIKTPRLEKFVGTACKIESSPYKMASCIFPIVDSFATYNAMLSYGRNVSETFRVKVVAEQYDSGGWKNPADISVYMDAKGSPGQTRLEVFMIYVTEYMAKTTSSPSFREFKVFHGNKKIIRKVWHDFFDYVFRRCKQDMRKVMKDSYAKWVSRNAAHTKPINDSLFWN